MQIDLVVDANILFSFFKSDSTTRQIITNFRLFKLHAPEIALEEIIKHKSLICNKAKISDIEFIELVEYLKTFIKFEDENTYKKFLPKAKQISPDLNDVAYFALALKFNCSIWSNEKQLKKQSIINIFSTSELINLFLKNNK